jgi:hypothetical protein
MAAFEPNSRRRLCAEFMDVDIEFLSSLAGTGDGTKYILTAEPFIRLALTGLKLWSKSSSLVGANSLTRPPNFSLPY